MREGDKKKGSFKKKEPTNTVRYDHLPLLRFRPGGVQQELHVPSSSGHKGTYILHFSKLFFKKNSLFFIEIGYTLDLQAECLNIFF